MDFDLWRDDEKSNRERDLRVFSFQIKTNKHFNNVCVAKTGKKGRDFLHKEEKKTGRGRKGRMKKGGGGLRSSVEVEIFSTPSPHFFSSRVRPIISSQANRIFTLSALPTASNPLRKPPENDAPLSRLRYR